MEFFESSTFRSLVVNLMQQKNTPGLSIAVVHNNAIDSAGFGMADLENKVSCTGDTLFDIASCSKSLTAASVALLVDDKEYPCVQYDSLMSSLLPGDFVMQENSYTDGITIEDVLSHRTGMASHDSSYMGPTSFQPDNAKSITRNLRNLKAAAPLRSRYLYCNQMFTVATYLVEKVTEKNFSDFLDERILHPLQMNSTVLQPERAISKGWGSRMAKGYIWEDTWRSIDPQNCPEGQGAGSIISSANDFIKFVKALLYQEEPVNYRVYQGLTKMRSIVNPTARRLKPHTTPAIYTAGMEMYFYRERMVIGHDGNIPGFASRFIFMPDLKFGVVVLGNSADAHGVSTTIIRALMDEVLQVPVEDRISQINSKEGRKNRNKKKSKKAEQAQIQIKQEKSQTTLEAYTGKYWNAGYHTMTVQLKDGQLYVDATDRSMGFTLTFEHVDEPECMAHVRDAIELGDEPMAAAFVWNKGEVVKMGLDLEPAIKEMIWFERQNDTSE